MNPNNDFFSSPPPVPRRSFYLELINPLSLLYLPKGGGGGGGAAGAGAGAPDPKTNDVVGNVVFQGGPGWAVVIQHIERLKRNRHPVFADTNLTVHKKLNDLFWPVFFLLVLTLELFSIASCVAFSSKAFSFPSSN